MNRPATVVLLFVLLVATAPITVPILGIASRGNADGSPNPLATVLLVLFLAIVVLVRVGGGRSTKLGEPGNPIYSGPMPTFRKREKPTEEEVQLPTPRRRPTAREVRLRRYR
jgi:hypothetical protein